MGFLLATARDPVVSDFSSTSPTSEFEFYLDNVRFINIVVEGHSNPGLFNHELSSPWLLNPRLFNHELFNHEFLNHGVEKFMVEKFGVEMSFKLVVTFQPQTFQP